MSAPRWLVSLLLPVLLGDAAGSVRAEAAPRRPPSLAWVFDVHPDKQLVPHGKVSLQVGARRVLIEPSVQAEFHTLSRTDYKELKIPATALTACSGWFAGGGEDLYVVQRRNTRRVYRRWTDEQAPEFPYRLIRSIPLPTPRFH